MTNGLELTSDFIAQLPGRAILVFARVLPIVVFTPIFGGEAVPRRFRLGFAVFLTGILVLAIPMSENPDVSRLAFAGLLVKEALIGATMAVSLRIMFEAFRAAGAMSDLFRGTTMASILDASSREQTSLLGAFYFQLAMVLLVSLGGLGLITMALAETFVTLPVFAPGPASLVGQPTTGELIGLLGSLFTSALKIAAPVLAIIVTTDLALGLLNRAAPQIQVFFLGFTVKGWLGLFATLLAINFSIRLMYRLMASDIGRMSTWFN